RNLKSKDTFSKSDAVCILYLKDLIDGTEVELGRTEEMKNNPNPDWMKKFEIEYKFEEKQVLIFRVYDWDKKKAEIKGQDLIGEVECTLAEIMIFQGKEVVKEMAKKAGALSITGQEVSGCKEVASLLFSGEGLDNKDTFGKSDPFLMISRSNNNGTFSRVINTGYLKDTLNPNWQPISVPLRTLCRGNYDASLKIECFDWGKNDKHELIGECMTTLNELKDGKAVPLINPKKASKKGYKNSGLLKGQIQDITIEKSFLDYLREGVQLHFTVAVDFTASNGKSTEPSSLHYLGDGDNLYMTAMKAVGEIILDYDADQLVPALGFGARIPPDNKVSHQFFMNGDPKDPYCKGIDGILEAYKKSVQTVELFGPTNFAPCIKQQAKFASKYDDGKHYFVLLIITDGVISDLPETLTALIDASPLAISVVIVGVGSEDFSAMKILDADGKKLSHDGKTAARDIIQFLGGLEGRASGWARHFGGC
ncbi:UNVERIFIED_CONTAM: hypothetical protein GTU68_020763, partial [Idotea baltica]|nr:hypothetical protein [Idotea baltica]